jgi:WD40 repeat protein
MSGVHPPELVAVFGPGSGPARALAFSPDGRFLLAAGEKQVRYWNIARLGPDGGKTPINFNAHDLPISSLAFAPEGRQFATASLDGTCKIWDTHEPACILALKPQKAGVTSVAFSPDGKTLATAGQDGDVRLWDRHSGRPRLVIAGGVGAVLSLAFAPDGQHIFWGGADHHVRWADVLTGTSTQRQIFAKAQAPINVLAFHPGGAQLVAGGGGDGALHLCRWDGKQLTTLRVLEHHKGAVHDLAFSPDGDRLVSIGDDHTMALCDANKGDLLRSWETRFVMTAVAFAPDGRHFAAGNAPGQNRGAVFIYRVPSAVGLANR